MESSIFQQPLFGLTMTVAAYSIATLLQKKWRFLHPLFVCSTAIVLILLMFRIPFEDYNKGADLLTVLLGPATVALGVPLYKCAHLIRQNLRRIAVSVIVGSMVGMVSSAVIAGLLGGSSSIVLSMMPKSVSSPIAIEIARHLGGIPELTAVLTALTGLFGSMIGTRLLHALGIKDDISIGIAMGAAAHGVGTAKVLKDSEVQGSFSGLAMALCGIVTSLLFIPVYMWLR